jgi:nucleotide-binding universal stress UspA family protein
MYAKILVPLDGSALAERAVHHAVEIASGKETEVILLRVIHDPLAEVPEAGQESELKATTETVADSQAYLDTVASRVRKEGIKVRPVVLEGTPDGAILGFAHDEDVDIIVMSTHGRTGFSKAIMGSVAEKVALTTKRPVVLVKPERVPKLAIDEVDVFLSAR